jgi:hypothetical protein
MGKIEGVQPSLSRIKELIPWESFRPLLVQGYAQDRKSNAGRKPIDPVMMFRMLVLQQLYNLRNEEIEYQVNDRRSYCFAEADGYEEFVGLGIMDSMPYAKIVWFFRERLIKVGEIEELLETFDQFLCEAEFEPKGGGRSLMLLLYLFQSNEIQERRMKQVMSLTHSRKTQTAFPRRILTHGGLKRITSTTTFTRTILALTGSMDSFANMTLHR